MQNSLVNLFQIPTVDVNRNYWIVRTNSGLFYDDFVLHQYIAISWDYVTLSVLNTCSEEQIKDLIRSLEKSNPTQDLDDIEDDDNSKTMVTTIYNKILRFVFEIKNGDIVLIPNRNSELISVAEVTGNAYEDSDYAKNYLIDNPTSEITPCPFYKRRKINIIKTLTKDTMDIYLAKGFNSQHALSSLNEYAPFIDRALYDIYVKNDELHSTLHTTRKEGLTLKELAVLINYLDETIDNISMQCEMPIDPRDVEVKLNIHCPGIIELIGYTAGAGAAISLIMFAINNLINGGKFKAAFKKDISGNLEFSIESETTGIKGNKLLEKELELKSTETLLKTLNDLGIKSPDIIAACLNNNPITPDMISKAIEEPKQLPNKAK